MKKIAGILICIAIAFSFAGCSWQVPEKVSVKTNAEYNFSLGNFNKDFSDQLNVSKMIGDLQLPNNGKLYDYWPDKKGDTQKYLMYMPLQEIPIDIGSYFDNGALAQNIKNISFSKEIDVPAINFSFQIPFDLTEVNKEINKQFVLAGQIADYSASAFGKMLKQIADSISYSKGYLIVKAYSLNVLDISQINSIASVVNEGDLDTSYSYGTVTITSGGKSISGTFYNGVAELKIPDSGFEFKSDDINISFSDKPIIPPHAFIARFDTSRDYQIKSVGGLNSAITIPAVAINKDIDSLESLKDSGVESCEIAEGNIEIDFDIPSEWKNVGITYALNMQGGINLTSAECSATSGGNNITSIPLNDVSISAEKIKVNAAFALSIADATIDFTKTPKIGVGSSITKIKSVTVKLSDTNLSISDSQRLPTEVLDFLKKITLKKCGIKGTYTNTLPEGNEITLNVASDFFNINDSQKIEGGANDKDFSLLSADESRTIELTKENPAPAGKYNAFDFTVGVSLPGGDSKKVTVVNVEPGKKYKLAVNVEPVIDWQSVTIDTSKLELPSDSIGTGFDPSTLFTSLNKVMGDDNFADKIQLPECKLYLYITRPELSEFEKLEFSGSEVNMYYGDSSKNQIAGTEKTAILKSTDTISFAKAAPQFEKEKNKDGSETVISKLKTSKEAGDITCEFDLSKLLASLPSSVSGDKQLCVEYNIKLQNKGGQEGEFTIDNGESNKSILEQSGSIGIYAVIELPLSFTVKGNTSISLLKLMQKDGSSEDKDLLGRSQANSMDQIKKFLDANPSASIDYTINAFPVETSDKIQIKLDLWDDEKSVYSRPSADGKNQMSIKTSPESKGNFTITSSDIENIVSAYPLKLKQAEIYFENDNVISIPREKKIDVNLQICISTDGKVELFDVNKK